MLGVESWRRPLLTAVVLAAAVVIVPNLATAQVIILRSTVDTLPSGKVLQRNARLSVPEGASVTVVLPSGETRLIAGPFDAKTSDLTRGMRSDPAVFDAVRSYVREQQTASGPGRVRSMASRASPGPGGDGADRMKFSWHDVPVTATGDICVEKGAELALVRSASGTLQSITVVDMNSAHRARTQFSADAVRIPWPSDLRLASGSFAILSPKQKMRQVRLRLIAPLPAPEQTLRVLHGQRCKLQFQAYLRGVMVAQK